MVMSKSVSSKSPSQPAPPRQINIALESISLQGLTSPERLRVLTHLANLLMLAAGIAIEERNHESR